MLDIWAPHFRSDFGVNKRSSISNAPKRLCHVPTGGRSASSLTRCPAERELSRRLSRRQRSTSTAQYRSIADPCSSPLPATPAPPGLSILSNATSCIECQFLGLILPLTEDHAIIMQMIHLWRKVQTHKKILVPVPRSSSILYASSLRVQRTDLRDFEHFRLSKLQ